MADRRVRWKPILVALLAGSVCGSGHPAPRPSARSAMREGPEAPGVERLYDYDRNALVGSVTH